MLTKTVSNPTPNVGDTITYTVTVARRRPERRHRRHGPGPAAGGRDVRLGHTQPGELRQRHGGLDGREPSISSTAQTLTIQATVASPNPPTNTATISHADQFDPNTANNTASATETPQQADLALTKTRQQPDPQRGRHDHLHRHADQQRPERRHERRR